MATMNVGGSYLSDLALLGNLGCLYDFTDPSTMEQSVGGGGGNPGNGDPVGLVMDQSGNGLDVSAPSGAGRPTFQTNVNGTVGAVLFNGSSEWLERLATSNITANVSAFTVLAVVKHAATPTGREPYALFSTGSNSTVRIQHNAAASPANKLSANVRRANADSLAIATSTTDIGTAMRFVTLRANYATDTLDCYLNGVLEDTAAIGGTSGANTQSSNGRIYIGGIGTANMNGHIFLVAGFRNLALNDAQLAAAWNLLRNKCQIT
jgi:hypothetical protein